MVVAEETGLTSEEEPDAGSVGAVDGELLAGVETAGLEASGEVMEELDTDETYDIGVVLTAGVETVEEETIGTLELETAGTLGLDTTMEL